MLNFNSLERGCSLEKLSENILSPIEMLTQQVSATQNYYAGLSKYVNDFLLPYLASTHYVGKSSVLYGPDGLQYGCFQQILYRQHESRQ